MDLLRYIRGLEYSPNKLELFCKEMVRRYGDTQMFIAIEEILEIYEVLDDVNSRHITESQKTEMLGELADCYIMMKQLCVKFDKVCPEINENILGFVLKKSDYFIRSICRGMRYGNIDQLVVNDFYDFISYIKKDFGISDKELYDMVDFKINRTVDRICLLDENVE